MFLLERSSLILLRTLHLEKIKLNRNPDVGAPCGSTPSYVIKETIFLVSSLIIQEAKLRYKSSSLISLRISGNSLFEKRGKLG